jgi:hypothetical protein
VTGSDGNWHESLYSEGAPPSSSDRSFGFLFAAVCGSIAMFGVWEGRRSAKRVARFAPDIIVIYEATNDLSANSYEMARDQGVIAGRPQVDDFDWLTRHSLLGLLVRKNLEIMRVQILATGNSGKAKLDTVRLDAEFRSDYMNLVSAGAKVTKIVVR